MNIGRRIRKQRRSLELSQESLAEALGCSQMHVSRIERGMAIPTQREIEILFGVLGALLADELRARS